MPVKFQLTFRIFEEEVAERDPLALRIYPDQLHGFFMNLLPQRLRNEFHKPSPVKPFSLWCEDIFQSSEIFKREFLSIEISLLRDEYFTPLLYHLSSLEEIPKLGSLKLKFSDFKGGFLKRDRYFSYSSPENGDFGDYLCFIFVTPTSFRRGEHDYPLPEPEYIFKSLIRKWNYLSDIKLPGNEFLNELRKAYIAYARFSTQTVYLSNGGAVTSFTGKLIIGRGKVREEIWRWYVQLGYFGEFCGVGKKTTMGLGKVLVRSLERENSWDI